VWNQNGGGRRLATHTVTPVSILQLIQYKEESGPFQANSIIDLNENAMHKEPTINPCRIWSPLGREGAGGEVNKREGQRGSCSQSWFENSQNTNMTDCNSSL
jgi:hypothetical protein